MDEDTETQTEPLVKLRCYLLAGVRLSGTLRLEQHNHSWGPLLVVFACSFSIWLVLLRIQSILQENTKPKAVNLESKPYILNA